MVIMLQSIVIVLFISSTTLGVYHEKTRFDRSLAPEWELQTLNEEFAEPITFFDYAMRYVAHKDVREGICYIQKLREDRWKSIINKKHHPRILYPSTLSLTNVEAWKLAGGRIVNFCDGSVIKLLQETRPIPAETQDPFLNEIPLDENDVVQKRITDVVLTPLLSRAKREIMLENREAMNQQFVRMPRQTYRHGGKFRGQTQSQYLNHGGESAKEGKAEAEATDQSSRALVSGSNGMGQAQSMSSGGATCEDCVGYSGSFRPGEIGVQPPINVAGYPSSEIPGSIMPGISGPYLGGAQQPRMTGGGPRWPTTYPSGVPPSGIPGTYGTYPGGVPSSGVPGTAGTYPSGIPIGEVPGTSGTYPSGVPPSGIPGTYGTYPGGVSPSGIPGTVGTYPSGIPIGGVPGTSGTYPGGVSPSGIPGTAGTYPSGIPIGEVPGTSGIYSGGVPPSGVPGTAGTYQSGIPIGGVPGTAGTYQSGIPIGGVPGSTGTYPGGVPSSGVPGTAGTYPSGIPIGEVPGTSGTYPGGVPPSGVPGTSGTYPGGVPPSGVPGSTGTYPGGFPPSGIPGTAGIYPSGIPTGGVPGTAGIYPGGVPPSGVPGTAGTYPGGIVTGQQYPGIPGIYPATSGIPGQPTSIYTGIPGVPGTTYLGGQMKPSGYPVYPAGTPSSIAGILDDGADSHASSSVKQNDSGTQASASSDGKFGAGIAQSQVTGTYSGSGSFSAQAGTSDGNRGAQSQISGGKEGGQSNAQGIGGQGKSQAQVQLNSDTGATMTGAQSTGLNHGTNSQVQASAKGGLADAQANGEGSTSSQAQIGFQPYTGSKKDEKTRSKPFKGGGQASAQSGTYRGQSQSQIDGSFQYGITYTGAAQAGSGAGVGASRKPFNFTNPDRDLFKSFDKFDPVTFSKTEESTTVSSDLDTSSADETNLKTGSSSRRTIIVRPQTRQEDLSESLRDDQSYGSEIEEYEEEDYVDEDYDEPPPPPPSRRKNSDMIKTRSLDESSRQIQMINIGNEKKHNVHVVQDSSGLNVDDVVQPGHTLHGYTIPTGFRGRVTSVSGEPTHAHGSGKSQAQTISVVPSSQGRIQVGKFARPETRSLESGHERGANSDGGIKNSHPSTKQMNGSHTKSMDTPSVKSKYFTVTKSVAGKLGDPRQKFEHRYYTKSSTCGYFTFSCNIVHGSNGRTKICKPKMPTYPDGTPMKC